MLVIIALIYLKMYKDYTIYYKQRYSDLKKFRIENNWDIYISAYNDSDRVKKVFKYATSKLKHWILLPDYNYTENEYPDYGKIFSYQNRKSESNLIIDYFKNGINKIDGKKICIDITGFMRPHLIYFIRYLFEKKIKKFDVIYTDPLFYKKAEKTTFTQDSVEEVRQIDGCQGQHITDTSNDFLIIGSGYDHKLITSVAADKDDAKKIQLFGFPSLKPDMFQENLLNAYKSEDEIGGKKFLDFYSSLFAPANDPFMTAQTIQEFINKENKKKSITNIYLSPLSTKAQTLGFALYYVNECINKPVSIIFPFCTSYTRETSEGIDKIWKYTIEFE